MDPNEENVENVKNVEVSDYIKKINSATPQGTPETRRKFNVMKRVRDFSDYQISELPVFKEPICLIDTNEEGILEVKETALLQIRRLDKPLVVVGIAGLYRTGKSYLMNRLARKANGFALGSTIQSKTKGIWVWALEHPCRPENYLLLLDTEGLGDAEKGNENHDNWIFSITTLLSGSLIYNSLGAINEDSLANLNFVTVTAKHIKSKTGEQEEEGDFDLISPLFIFVLRDFSLILEIDGNEVTSDEYMEHCLKLKEGDSDDTKHYNRPRLCVRTYFKRRKCFTFDRPVSKQKMKYLDLFIDSGLSQEFKEEVDGFVEYVHNEALLKRLSTGQTVNGPIFCSLVTTYLEAINNGTVPDTEGAIKNLSVMENQKAVEAATKLYKKLMYEKLNLPVSSDDLLSQVHLEWHKEAVRFFMEKAILDEGDTKLRELNEILVTSFEEFKEEDKKASTQKCWAILHNLEQSLVQKLRTGAYATEGGYNNYYQDLQAVLNLYNKRQDLGNQKEICLLDYRNQKIDESETVMTIDKLATEKERKTQEELQKALRAEKEKQSAKRERDAIKRMAEEKERRLQQTKQEIEIRNAKHLQEMNQHYETILQQKLREQERLLREGHEKQAAELRNQINRFRRK